MMGTPVYLHRAEHGQATVLVNAFVASATLDADVQVLFLNCMAHLDVDALRDRLAGELSSESLGRRIVGWREGRSREAA